MISEFFKRLSRGESVTDEAFDALLSQEFHEHSNRHFTSIFIAQKAIAFLTEDSDAKILDIGSGTGKFCLIGAVTAKNEFTGVEYRPKFVDAANSLSTAARINNARFFCDDILNIDFADFDNFYMFNPFLEHKDPSAKMDLEVAGLSQEYEVFRKYVHDQFSKMPVGTRVATYYVGKDQFPESYQLVAGFYGGTLCFWEKVH
jgi:SAM-dependent methyltransferase